MRHLTPNTIIPRLQIITEGQQATGTGLRIEALLERLSPTLPCMVQIREKNLTARELFRLASSIRMHTHASSIRILINERLDIALAAGLDGVHLPEKACPIDPIRQHAKKILIGRSVHSLTGVDQATTENIDYILFSPIFDTPSKRAFGPPQGLDALEKACRRTHIPILALGGISIENAKACIDAGAWGIAAIGMFSNISGVDKSLEYLENLLS